MFGEWASWMDKKPVKHQSKLKELAYWTKRVT